ncbi:enoyl-[acyl-carrier-protein] reductase, mitochondrial-like [Mercenaria mercenaria]|uniref:enoyl-[acyl-carrier-protein] reductase, mitochondrial-like n=1 Tax=Mercenaria mercenaria TaxID=6596 RepID=UPI00234F5A43|nr:enoyl-[acyl-carrier-protein] reductase, mitochondrial-like [Mercenaria mercenaria]
MSKICAKYIFRTLFRIQEHGSTNATFTNVHRRYASSVNSMSVVYNEYGNPNKVLKTENCQLSKCLQADEVLVKMLMAPVNPSDINMVEGTYFMKPKLPAVAGNEGVGEVLDVGTNVKSLKTGDWVIPNQAGFGTWRTHAVADYPRLRKISNDIPPLSAATIVVNPSTAYRMLKDFGNLKPGDVVIQNSANSAVGQSVIQIAKAWNLRTINIVRGRDNLDDLVEQLKQLGATHVVTEEFSRTPEMKELIKSLGAAPKLALNGVGGKSATELLRHLASKGVMVTYGGMSRQPVVVPTGVFIFKEVTAVGYWNSQWNIENDTSPERDTMFEELCDMIRECKLIPPPCEIFELENYSEAVRSAMEGFQGKKKVLSMQDFQ